MSRAVFILVTVLAASAGGCRTTADPARATRPYPYELHLEETLGEGGEPVRAPRIVDIQAFRDDIWLEIVNSTARSFADFDVWVNQRHTYHVDSMPAGAIVRLSLFEFYDELGERFNAGGFCGAVDPEPVRMVELEVGGDEPLIGLITIRAEEAE